MRDVKVRLECVRQAGEWSIDPADVLKNAKELYDWVIEDDGLIEIIGDDHSDSSIRDWGNGFDKGYDCGYESALEAAETVLNHPETHEVEDDYDRGYLDGVESVVDAVKENQPTEETE